MRLWFRSYVRKERRRLHLLTALRNFIRHAALVVACPFLGGSPAGFLSYNGPDILFIHQPTMSPSSSRSIRIAEPTTAAAASRARKQFNSLMKKLEAERLRLAAWHDTVPQLRALFEGELVPLVHAYDTHRKQLLFLFDQAYTKKGIGKRERDKLEDLIYTIALELLDAGPDEEVDRILDKYDEAVLADAPELDEPDFKQALDDLFGMELDEDADGEPPESEAGAWSAKMAEREQAEQQRRAEREHKRKPSARELRQQEEAQKVQQSLREIYRKLVSDLHPDREPDEAERKRKTALMQRANVAYEKKDLLALLELQVEVAHIDQAGLDKLSDERIKQYNRVLERQWIDLERETMQLEYGLMMEFQLQAKRRLTPAQALGGMREHIVHLRLGCDEVAQDMREFQDIKKLKAWLKTYRITDPDDFGNDWY